MWQGNVVSIHVAPEAAAPMVTVQDARALPGRGLEGDRYCTGHGHYSARPSVGGREITLIEIEAIEALEVKIGAAETRRNIATQGVPLNHLIDRTFRIGTVRLRGTRLCEPCKYLDRLTSPGVMKALVHRGGLRAQILTEGTIRVGYIVRPD
jgi:MOSC domain-containing protein YiiM